MANRNPSLEMLRGIAAFGIVGCHLALEPLTQGGVWVRALSDMNVGLFATLSGYLMWREVWTDGAGPYIVKRCRRLLPVYLLWSVLYLSFGLIYDGIIRHGLNPKLFAWDYYVDVLFLGRAATHLWFLISLLYGQILLRLLLFIRLKPFVYFELGLLIVAVAAFFTETWFGHYPLRLFGFLVTGYGIRGMLSNRCPCQRHLFIWSSFLGVAIILHYLLVSYVPTFIRDAFVVIPLLVLFVTLDCPTRFVPFAKELGRCSMGVFLVHPVIVVAIGLIVKKMFRPPFSATVVLGDWFTSWILAMLISVFLVRIPRLQKWVC